MPREELAVEVSVDDVEEELFVAAILDPNMAAGIDAGLAPSTRKSYAELHKKFYEAHPHVEVGSMREKGAFVVWGNKYMCNHPRGGSHIGKVLAALILEHLKRGIQSWGQSADVRKWARGWLKNRGCIQATVHRKVHTAIPASFVDGLMKSAEAAGELWLSLIYRILFYGLPRSHHFLYFLIGDIFIPNGVDINFFEIYLGGLKTEDSVAKGCWMSIPGGKPTMVAYLALRREKGAQRWDDLFPEYSNDHVNKYARQFGEVNGYATLDVLSCHSFRGAGAQHARSEDNLDTSRLAVKGNWTKDSSSLQVSYLSKGDPLVLTRAGSVKFEKLIQMKRMFKPQTSMNCVTKEMMVQLELAVKDLDQETYHFYRKLMMSEQDIDLNKVARKEVRISARPAVLSAIKKVTTPVSQPTNFTRISDAEQLERMQEARRNRNVETVEEVKVPEEAPFSAPSTQEKQLKYSEQEERILARLKFLREASTPIAILSTDSSTNGHNAIHEGVSTDDEELESKRTRLEAGGQELIERSRVTRSSGDLCSVCNLVVVPTTCVTCSMCERRVHRKCSNRGRCTACKEICRK